MLVNVVGSDVSRRDCSKFNLFLCLAMRALAKVCVGDSFLCWFRVALYSAVGEVKLSVLGCGFTYLRGRV